MTRRVLAWRPGADARRRRRAEAQVPGWVDALARGLRAGRSLVGALRDASAATPAPLGPEVQALVRRIDAGAGVRAAVADVRARTANVALGRALAAVALAHEAGGAHAPAFDALAGSLRAHAAAERELRALATPVRTSAIVIGLAPLGVLGLVGLSTPATLLDAWTTPVGAGALVAGLAAEGLGVWWIRTLTRVAP